MALSLEFIETFEKSITKSQVVFTQTGLGWEEEKPPTINELEEMKLILKFSIPKIKVKVDLGKELWKTTPTILW